MHTSNIAAVLQSLSEKASRVRVHGATFSAQALLISRWTVSRKNPVAIICPDDESAAQMSKNIQTLSAVVDQKNINVLHLPTWEQSPYSPIVPSLRTRITRISTLSKLHLLHPKTIIVASMAAACQSTIPPELLIRHRIELNQGKDIPSREIMSRHLFEAGYLRTDTVEDPGTFSLRGEIIDIFPPNTQLPLRVELFGDNIERIRFFDPRTQRTLAEEQLPSGPLYIPPAREVLINSQTYPTLRKNIKEYADNLGISRKIRDPVLDSFAEGVYPDHADAWAPFAYEDSSSLWDHLNFLKQNISIIYTDQLGCEQEIDSFLSKQQELAADPLGSGTIIPPVEKLFVWTPEIEKKVVENICLFLDRIDFSREGSETDRVHRVFTRDNSDISSQNQITHKNDASALLDAVKDKIEDWLESGIQVIVLASTHTQLERIQYLFEKRGIACEFAQEKSSTRAVLMREGIVSSGFRWPDELLVVLTEEELVGKRLFNRNQTYDSKAKTWSGLQTLSDLSIGDAVVHIDHGIGRYRGLVRLVRMGASNDFLLIEYANNDKLYLPVYRLNVVQKYLGGSASIALDRLGSKQFEKTKEKVRESVRKLAFDLIQLYAQRELQRGFSVPPRDTVLREFEAKFPFNETRDQFQAVEDILSDLVSGKPMDRLICGDVGFGKTEVAMRAAFQIAMAGRQVAVLVPTTILAFQHEQTFLDRFKDYPIVIDSLSRFKSRKEQKKALELLAQGKTDIIIGTHRLLSKDVSFKNLGLIIVDEEHRFGVEHKERLKTIKLNTHVLTLTATPIPRTLHLALSGLREISIMTTPPVDRLPIRTFISKFDESLITRAIEFELSRGGQVFVLHNRVQSIFEIAKQIKELVPAANVIVAHGQMSETELENQMLQFYQKHANVLVCTTIIEAGLDIPSANTIIINRADTFGLAQLYQLRGRVGRSEQRAYAYLIVSPSGKLTEEAKSRLETIQRFVELGSGFNVASHDLEIRGGGNMLGAEQSGHIAAVGFDLYTELLDEAIREIRGKSPSPEESSCEPEINSPYPAYLDEKYISDIHQRLSLYRRLSSASNRSDLIKLEEELMDRFGPLPEEATNLLWVIQLKQLLKKFGIISLTAGKEKTSLVPGKPSRLIPEKAIAIMSSTPNEFHITPESKVVITYKVPSIKDLYFKIETVLESLTDSP